MTTERISKHAYYMGLAKMASLRSTCMSRPVGAIAVKDDSVITTGYNGSMRGASHCIDDGCYRRIANIPDAEKANYCRAIHAEANMVAQAARKGLVLDGATVYVTLSPCYNCLKLMANAGIVAVYYEYEYGSKDTARDDHWAEVVKESPIKIFTQLSMSDQTIERIKQSINYPTSRRKLEATA